MSNSVALSAPAKLNLYLHVTGRRPDGYHLLDSVVAFASLADRLTATDAPGAGVSLELSGPFAPALVRGDETGGDGNLVLRAVRALTEHAGATRGSRPGARLHLTKNIPVAAGLGGGSADAAATLVALTRLWNLPAVPLVEIAAGLGADVPACLASVPVHMSGVGEVLAPVALPLPGAGLVLANPGIALDTRAVFAEYDRATAAMPGPATGRVQPPAGFGVAAPDAAALAAVLGPTANDLTAAAVALAPAVADVLGTLAGAPGCLLARMAGSGATCFGLFAGADDAATAARAIGEAHPGWWCRAALLSSGRPSSAGEHHA